MRQDARPQARKNRKCIRWNTVRIFSGRERRRWLQIICRSRTVNVGQAPRSEYAEQRKASQFEAPACCSIQAAAYIRMRETSPSDILTKLVSLPDGPHGFLRCPCAGFLRSRAIGDHWDALPDIQMSLASSRGLSRNQGGITSPLGATPEAGSA
jgi:hypothetical protein